MRQGVLGMLAVWTAALVSAAALAYTLRAPADIVAPSTHVRAVKFAAVVTYVAEPHALARYAALASPTAVASIASPPRDISVMHCSGWRQLEQGSERVQVCD